MKKENGFRKEEIESKISDIVDSVSVVEENMPASFEDFSGLGLVKDGLYKKLEFAIESVLDICNIINSDLRLGSPETEDSVTEHLGRKKIFDKKVLDIIREIKGFRNILVHKYGEINDEMAFETIKERLGDFDLIVKEVEKFLRR